MLETRAFVRFAALFEVGLAILAVGLGWLAGITPTAMQIDARAIGIGVVATVPLIAMYEVATRLPLKSLRRIHDLLLSTLGRPLSECRWHELALLAALAGVCEELLFRGVLQPWLTQLGEPAGWIGTNLLFGFAHAVTPTYFVLATGIGFYLSGIQALAGSLFAPMLAHALYDWYAFHQVAKAYRKDAPDDAKSESESD